MLTSLSSRNTSFPIDLVYTWSDGQDPRIKRLREQAVRALHLPEDEDTTGWLRYEQHDEFKYALRSAMVNLPWIRHIFIVTDQQVPTWFHSYPKVTIVDHTEIIPAHLLPTFSSVCIETFLNNIPGLSEHFIYSNDDCFINRPLGPQFFSMKTVVLLSDLMPRKQIPSPFPKHRNLFKIPTQKGGLKL